MSTPLIFLPGDQVPNDQLPASKSGPLKLGSGLRLLSQPSAKPSEKPSEKPSAKPSAKPAPPPQIVTATQAGILTTDTKRNTASLLTFPNRRYIPTANDLVIAQIHHSSPDYFYCIVTPHTPHALLPQLAFEGATKKTRPQLKGGDLVYARVSTLGVGAGAEVELTCVNPATGKSEPGGLGPINGGMVFDVSTGMAARLLRASSSSADDDEGIDGIVLLSELAKKLETFGGFELAVGRNGKVWVNCPEAGEHAIRVTIAIGQCLQKTDDQNLDPTDQRKLVTKTLRKMKVAA